MKEISLHISFGLFLCSLSLFIYFLDFLIFAFPRKKQHSPDTDPGTGTSKREFFHSLGPFVRRLSFMSSLQGPHHQFSGRFPLSTYNNVNHMLVVSRCFVSWKTKGAQISTRHLRNVCLGFLGKCSMKHEPVAFHAHVYSCSFFQPVFPTLLLFAVFLVFVR